MSHNVCKFLGFTTMWVEDHQLELVILSLLVSLAFLTVSSLSSKEGLSRPVIRITILMPLITQKVMIHLFQLIA